jgi:hypothetical protein
MLVYIELFNDLDIDKKNNFMDHLKYISTDLVNSVLNFYLSKIAGDDYTNTFMTNKDFLGLLTIYHYSEEFLLNSEEFDTIKSYIDTFYYLNKNYKNTKNINNINDYYKTKIEPNTKTVKKIFKGIFNTNRESVCENYAKIYLNLKNLVNDLSESTSKTEIESYKTHYYNLLKEILKNNTDSYLKTQEKTQIDNNEYDNFRKKLFMDNLKNDLSKEPPDFSGVVYLIDIIRKKLCYISPTSSKYNSIKEKINSILDIDYLKQLVTNNVFDNSVLLNIFNFIIEKIKEFQSEDEDKELNSWVQDIKTKYIDNFSNETLKTHLPLLLDKIMNKIEKLELNVTNYRNKINNTK